jgi:hypothetical protein
MPVIACMMAVTIVAAAALERIPVIRITRPLSLPA